MNFDHFYYGGDYNPDQWPEEVWQEDVRLMQEAGVNLVTLGVFSWAKLEPEPGKFDFGWMDRIFDLLYAHGVSVDLATPTAAPPAWMIMKHPEIRPVNNQGITLWHGSRRHYCPHNPDYHFYAARIAAQLAEHYKDHPALAMWHIDNEYGCHISECYCQNSASEFRNWLKDRYGSLARLNDAWGTSFWSQAYSDWQQINPPLITPTTNNPTQVLDWSRFSSDSWLNCFLEQKQILKQITPNIPVTTNFMCFFKGIDYFNFAKNEDIVSNDSYPDTGEEDWHIQTAMYCDLMRGLGKGEPWMLMEQAPSAVNWRQTNSIKKPGIMRLGSMQAISRGANGIMFFQWRQSKAGSEKHHSGMVPHGGTETRTWREIKGLGNELKGLPELLNSKVKASTAILMDWNNWWALELESKPSCDLKLVENIQKIYKPLYERNITADFATPDSDLSSYELVIIPNLYLIDEASARNIDRYVFDGGHVLVTYFSGIVDSDEHIHLGGYPAPFRQMLGLRVEEFVPYSKKDRNKIITIDEEEFSNLFWADVIHLEGSQSLAGFDQDYYRGFPAVTRHEYGKGTAYYMGTELEAAGTQWLIDLICNKEGISPIADKIPESIEIVKKENGSKKWYFIMNHSENETLVPWEKKGRDLITQKLVESSIFLGPHELAIVQTDNA